MHFIPFGDIIEEIDDDGNPMEAGLIVECKRKPGATSPDGRFESLIGDTYRFSESFCGTPGCDCRRAMFQVHSVNAFRLETVIAWGWENERFYRKWMGSQATKQDAAEMKGPILNPGSLATERAADLLDLFKTMLLTDRDFVMNTKEHYKMFKEAIDVEADPEDKVLASMVDFTESIGAAKLRPGMVEVDHEEILGDMETRTVELFREHPEMTDHVARRVYETFHDRFRAIAKGRQPKPHRLEGLDVTLFDRLTPVCDDWLVSNSAADSAPRSTPEILGRCFKKLIQSLELWNKQGGRTGYLAYISRFM